MGIADARGIFDLVREYRIECVLVGLWVLGPLFTFMAIQRLKRIAPTYLHRRLNDREVDGLAFATSVCLTMLVGSALAPIAANVLAANALLIGIALPYSVKLWMSWAKNNRPGLYRALRSDRRNIAGTPQSSTRRRRGLDDTDMFV